MTVMWPIAIAEVTVSAVFIGLLIRTLWRYEQHASRIELDLDRFRDEMIALTRAQVDRAIAEMELTLGQSAGRVIEVHASDTLKLTQIGEACSAGVPTEEEIRALPRWARVAFAARCARRVLPLVKHFWKDLPEYHLQTLSHTVDTAEQAARDGMPVSAPRPSAEVFPEAADFDVYSPLAYAAADAAVYAARAASLISDTASTEAVANAIRAAEGVSDSSTPEQLIRRDFEMILDLAKANNWHDDTPVSPSVFGPLWPEGPPEDWPKPEHPATQLSFTFGVPDDMTTAEAIELAKELSTALCELHLAGGGHGLAIQPPLEITAPVRAGVPVR